MQRSLAKCAQAARQDSTVRDMASSPRPGASWLVCPTWRWTVGAGWPPRLFSPPDPLHCFQPDRAPEQRQRDSGTLPWLHGRTPLLDQGRASRARPWPEPLGRKPCGPHRPFHAVFQLPSEVFLPESCHPKWVSGGIKRCHTPPGRAPDPQPGFKVSCHGCPAASVGPSGAGCPETAPQLPPAAA